MHVFQRGRPKAARWVLALGVLAAFPIVGSGVAQAAMGGANPSTTSVRPDLRSVHELSGINAGRVQFCFDKPVSNAGLAGANFRLGGYRWDTILSGLGAVLDSNTSCVDVLFANHDLTSYSFGTVTTGAVTANISGGQPNVADSAPNLDATDHSGTAGHTTGPDLQSVIVGSPAGANEIIYQFDQSVDVVQTAADFGYVNSSGTIITGAVVTGISGTAVRVAFATPVLGAQQAFVDRGIAPVLVPPSGVNGDSFAVSSDTPTPETENPTESVPVPGASGISAAPTLAAASLVGSNQIAYTFNQPIVALGVLLGQRFLAVASNGDEIAATGTPVIESDGRTVLATFPTNLSNYQEEIVVASVQNNVVTNPNVTAGNPPEGTAVGDNTGAFSTGFTNGPDATGATFNGTTGQVTVQFDQRVANGPAAPGVTPPNPAKFHLRDAAGFDVTPAGAVATSVATTAFQSSVTVSYNNPQLVTSVVANGGSLEIIGNQNPNPGGPFATFAGNPTSAVFTFGDPHPANVSGMNPAGNVQQLIGATASAVSLHNLHFKRIHIAAVKQHSKKHHSKKHTKKHSRKH